VGKYVERLTIGIGAPAGRQRSSDEPGECWWRGGAAGVQRRFELIERAVADLAAGRPLVVLVDDEDRENEVI
jgi:hypothetical protein